MKEAKTRILIVDDEEPLRNVLYRKLKSEGYDCDMAADGKEALRKASMSDFALVLTDIKMPGMSGLEVLPQIVTNHPDISVVMLTAMVDTKTAVEAMKQGAYDYVTKPFDMDDLSIRVKRALERRRLVLENREYQRHLEEKVEQQVGQIRQYYQEAMAALSREQIVLEKLGATRKSKQAKDLFGEEIADKSGELSTPVQEFGGNFSQLFGVGTQAPPEERVSAVSAQAETVDKEVKEQLHPSGGEEDEKESLTLYSGVVELAILPNIGFQQVMKLHEHLRHITHVKVLNLGGSVDKGITIRLLLEAPVPLIRILKDMSDVEKVSGESGEAENVVPARQEEAAMVRRIVVGLLKRSS